MEEDQEMEEQKQTTRWTCILLIIDIIIALIIGFIAFIFNSIVVNAAAIDYNSGANYIHKYFPTAEFIQFGRGVDFSLNSAYAYDKVNIQWTNYQAGVADIAIVLKLVSGTLATYSCNDIYQMFSVVENAQDTGATYRRKECRITGNEIDLKLYWRTTLEGGANSYMEVQLNRQFSVATVVNAYGVMTVNSIDPATNTDIQDQTNALINNNNSNTQVITNTVENSTTNIINQMQDNLNLCENYNYTNTPIKDQNKYLNEQGLVLDLTGNNVSDYVPLSKNQTYTLSINYSSAQNGRAYCIYKKDKTLISCQRYTQQSFTITPTEDGYIRYTINKTANNLTTDFTGKYCKDRTEAEIEELKVLQQLMHTEPWETVVPNQEDFDTTHEMENDILDMSEDIDLDNIDIDIDSDTSNWVWTTLTSLLNTNTQVFGMVISILSVGIIKLILNR